MSLANQILFFLSALGAFNGMNLSIYLFLTNRNRSVANYFLALLLFALSLRIGKSVFLFFYPEIPRIFMQIGLSACYFIGIFLYYYLRSAQAQIGHVPRSWKWIIGAHVLLVLTVGLLFPFGNNIDFWRERLIPGIYLLWTGYTLAALGVIWPILRKTGKTPLKAYEKWILSVYFCHFPVLLSYILSIFNVFRGVYISGAVSFSFILYLIIIVLLFRKKTDDLFGPEVAKYGSKKIPEQEARRWMDRLQQLLNEEALYTDANLKLGDLAQRLHISPHQLSQLLNEHLGKNFSTFINEYRIRRACALIDGDDRLKLEAVGYEVGFNSRSTFFAAFKKVTGTTPLLYREKGTDKA
jgi:AraC-like DNA-binding protein